jgi:hypothetical protein
MKPDYEVAWKEVYDECTRDAQIYMNNILEKAKQKEELKSKISIETALYAIRNDESLQARRKGWISHVLRSVNGVVKKYYPKSGRYCQYFGDHYDFNKQDWIIEAIPIKFYSIEEAQKAFKAGKPIKHENWKKWYVKGGEEKVCSLGTVLIEMQEDRWMIK